MPISSDLTAAAALKGIICHDTCVTEAALQTCCSYKDNTVCVFEAKSESVNVT